MSKLVELIAERAEWVDRLRDAHQAFEHEWTNPITTQRDERVRPAIRLVEEAAAEVRQLSADIVALRTHEIRQADLAAAAEDDFPDPEDKPINFVPGRRAPRLAPSASTGERAVGGGSGA